MDRIAVVISEYQLPAVWRLAHEGFGPPPIFVAVNPHGVAERGQRYAKRQDAGKAAYGSRFKSPIRQIWRLGPVSQPPDEANARLRFHSDLLRVAVPRMLLQGRRK